MFFTPDEGLPAHRLKVPELTGVLQELVLQPVRRAEVTTLLEVVERPSRW